jgi:hypothetical protein
LPGKLGITLNSFITISLSARKAAWKLAGSWKILPAFQGVLSNGWKNNSMLLMAMSAFPAFQATPSIARVMAMASNGR